MKSDLRIVIDTGVVVSAVLLPRSLPRQAFDVAAARGRLLVSDETIAELDDVLRRPKFDKYSDGDWCLARANALRTCQPDVPCLGMGERIRAQQSIGLAILRGHCYVPEIARYLNLGQETMIAGTHLSVQVAGKGQKVGAYDCRLAIDRKVGVFDCGKVGVFDRRSVAELAIAAALPNWWPILTAERWPHLAVGVSRRNTFPEIPKP